METIVYKCDNCGTEAVGRIPEKWFLLGYAITRNFTIEIQPEFTITHHFCSEECMDNQVKVGEGRVRSGEKE